MFSSSPADRFSLLLGCGRGSNRPPSTPAELLDDMWRARPPRRAAARHRLARLLATDAVVVWEYSFAVATKTLGWAAPDLSELLAEADTGVERAWAAAPPRDMNVAAEDAIAHAGSWLRGQLARWAADHAGTALAVLHLSADGQHRMVTAQAALGLVDLEESLALSELAARSPFDAGDWAHIAEVALAQTPQAAPEVPEGMGWMAADRLLEAVDELRSLVVDILADRRKALAADPVELTV